jgi:hypothetical protein
MATGETLTAKHFRNETVSAMGSELGEIYHSPSEQVAWLHLKWDTFCELFAERDTVDLLNSAAPAYFTNCNARPEKTCCFISAA